ncbi:MAG: STM4012 family radical SAM protein [Planctomycetia bacterium]|nr:STM4012 family radical SAM protein [Planctomycetia bacterium]
MSTALSDLLPPTYTAYAYSYPHKSSYAPLDPIVRLAEAWQSEDRQSLLLYLHIPFCEMRCGFCNLFAASQPADELVNTYLASLERQAAEVHRAIQPARFAAMAVGGGTPTFLDVVQLERLLELAATFIGSDLRHIPVSVETSPHTADRDRLLTLFRHGVSRISIGVQSFLEADTRALGRPQRLDEVISALDTIRSIGFPTLNIDLIFGAEGQTRAAWLGSIREALRFRPEELYLYPLYVRPMTGLAGKADADAARQLELYRVGRDVLLEQGYRQQSLRAFYLPRITDEIRATYSCQQDGMVGLGCGARSYTTDLHYSSRFQVGQQAIRQMLQQWVAQSEEQFGWATHGFRLSADERRRRHVILSLLQAEGLDVLDFVDRFGTVPSDEFPLLPELINAGLAAEANGRLQLTVAGMEQSDAIGPALYSDDVRAALTEFALR